MNDKFYKKVETSQCGVSTICMRFFHFSRNEDYFLTFTFCVVVALTVSILTM